MAAVPIADFSGTPTSGFVSESFSFSDLSTNTPTGWSWFFGDETYSQTWTQQTSTAGWTGRYVFSSVVLPDGSIVLIGGRDTTLTQKNDTWRSTNKGETWIQQTSSAGWKPRSSHSSVVMSDGSIVMTGGANDSYYMNDTWRSLDKGVSWTQQTSKASWLPRAGHSSVVMADGSIIIIGGQIREGSNYYSKNDVWRSTNNGVTWTQQTPSAGWTGRYGHSCVVMSDDTIILTGGWDINGNYKNDVWRSTNQGVTWIEQTASASWTARYSHTSVVMPDDSIVLMGGRPGYLQEENDTWRSTDKGISWTQLPDAGWPGRADFSSVALPDGSVVVMGGYDGVNSFKKDVWRYNPVGSSEENPSHIYNSAGVYNVALQAYNSEGYSNLIKNDYISVTNLHSSASGIGLPLPVPTTIPTPVPPPFADFSAATTMGMAPLNVAFTDQSINNPSSWYWSFGDQTMSTLQHPTHIYANPGIYSVSLTATNSGGSHTKTRTSHIIVNKTEAITDFTGSPITGENPLTVTFTDRSGNKPVTWRWSFGDGMISTVQNPVYVYKKAGTFTVSLTTTDVTGGTSTKTRSDYISVLNNSYTLIVSTITPNSGVNTDVVTNVNLAGSGFKPGATIRLTQAGNSDIFASNILVESENTIQCRFNINNVATGSWNIVVTNPDGQSAILPDGFTVINPAPVADFTASQTSGGAPLKVFFTDKSKGNGITTRLWQYKRNSFTTWSDIPYAGSSTNSFFTFNDAGVYDVRLIITSDKGTDTKTLMNYIKVDPTCKVELRSGIPYFSIPNKFLYQYTGTYITGPKIDRIRHNRIVFTDYRTEKVTIFEGGPAGSDGLKGLKDSGYCSMDFPWPLGQLLADARIYDSDPSDMEGYDSPDMTVVGHEVCEKYDCLQQKEVEIKQQCLAYNLFYPNSNSVVYTLLDSCGFETPNPKNSQGWDLIYLPS